MIYGIGIDIVEIKRLRKLRKKHQTAFLQKCFTAAEIAYCTAKKNADESFAVRFAAKEAVMKALGTGWSSGVAFNNIEIIRHDNGAPFVQLNAAAAQVQQDKNISHFLLSLSHSKHYAVAQVVAMKK